MRFDPLFTLLVVAVFLIQLIHQERISDQQKNETENGPLLCHPETERCSADRKLVEILLKEDSTSKGSEKPNQQ